MLNGLPKKCDVGIFHEKYGISSYNFRAEIERQMLLKTVQTVFPDDTPRPLQMRGF